MHSQAIQRIDLNRDPGQIHFVKFNDLVVVDGQELVVEKVRPQFLKLRDNRIVLTTTDSRFDIEPEDVDIEGVYENYYKHFRLKHNREAPISRNEIERALRNRAYVIG